MVYFGCGLAACSGARRPHSVPFFDNVRARVSTVANLAVCSDVVVQEKVLMCGQAAVPRLQQHLPRSVDGC